MSPGPETDNTCPVLLVILDGAADRPQEIFNHRTPLQASNIPHLNTLAGDGTTGLLRIGPSTLTPDSTTAHGLLWGLSPDEIPPRSRLEARTRGIDFQRYNAFAYFSIPRVTPRENSLWITERNPDEQPIGVIDDFCERPFSHEDWKLTLRRLNTSRGLLLGRYTTGSFDESLRLTDSDPFANQYPVIEPQFRGSEEPSEPQQQYIKGIKKLMNHSWTCLKENDRLVIPYWHCALRESPLSSPLVEYGLCTDRRHGKHPFGDMVNTFSG